MKPAPTNVQAIALGFLALCIVVGALILNHSEKKFKGSAPAVLDNEYTEVTGKSSHFEVKYTFTVGGVEYRGEDNVYVKPESPDTTAYFNPKNPGENALKESSPDGRFVIAAIACLVGAIIAYAFLPIHPDGAVQSSPYDLGTPIGDARGEYLTMEPGRYPATFYVGMAFFGQMAITTIGLLQVNAATIGHSAPNDVVVATVALFAVILTVFIYWDRWKCTTMFASRLCSGCANLSVLYVPAAALLYANYRGLMKLSGR